MTVERSTAPRRGWRSHVPSPLRHGVVVFLALLVLEYLVIPRFVVASHSLHQLSRLNVGWLLGGVVAEGASLFCYALLTRALLPGGGPGLSKLFRVTLSASAVAHVVPGGSAASAGLGYRLLTAMGVDGADVGVAMATQGIGSAVVLNVLLWFALIISIPIAGLRSGRAASGNVPYVTLALFAMLALLAIAALIYALTRGEEAAARAVRAIGRRIPRVSEDRLESTVKRIGQSLRDLSRDRETMKRALLWASVNWLLDAASLWAFLAALGYYADPIELFVAYGVGNVVAAIPLTPGGLGIIDTIVPALLTSFGATKNIAVLGVIGWRLANFWLPIPIGAGAYVSLRFGRGAGLKARRQALSDMTNQTAPREATPPGI